jgi:hypothetical protein
MKKKPFLLLGCVVLLLTSYSSRNPSIATNKDISLVDAKNYLKNYRTERQLISTTGADDNLTEGYMDLTTDQLVELLNQAKSTGQKSVRIYSGFDGNNYYLLLNGIDGNGVESKSNSIKSISIGGIRPTDCPKYCDITSTLLYSK